MCNLMCILIWMVILICLFCSAAFCKTFLCFMTFFIVRIPGWSGCITVASVLRRWMAEAVLTVASQVSYHKPC